MGESGCPVFHYATKRIIGLALGKGQAIGFTPLFAIWDELGEMSDDVAKTWGKRLRQLLPKTNNDSRALQGQTVMQQTLNQNGANISGNQVNIVGDVSEFNMSTNSK
ncbi:hypothetical protein THIOM_004950 [Candidatus Thiomargarita nelsonii]|uniref:Uncharacterized protein n=1 Tax=Candidatus Thiomargarita nelsonii TaxID=1003181 RepID=A0A176RUI4_9GAMM|nr:hypothetical protein THIOM_004950 [Candidatus Thiomargarita nelsonii]